MSSITKYFNSGWAIVPVHAKSKRAAIEWSNGSYRPYATAEEAVRACENLNVGIALGERSGNLIDVDIDHATAERIAYLFLPDTRMFGHGERQTSHRLYYVDEPTAHADYPDLHTDDAEKTGKPLIELRGDGNMTVFPGSIHQSGEPIEWANRDAAIETINAEDLRRRLGMLHAATLFALHTDEGTRHHVSLPIGGWLARAGYPLDDAVRLAMAFCRARGSTDERDSIQAVRDSYRHFEEGKNVYGRNTLVKEYFSGKLIELAEKSLGIVSRPGESVLRFTDRWNAMLFKNKHGTNVRYCAEEKAWHVWNGKCWEKDTHNRTNELADDVLTDIFNIAKNLPANDANKEDAWKWVAHTSKRDSLDAMFREASKVYASLKVAVLDFDTKHNLLVCANGTLDLDTQTLLPFKQEDMITKQIETEYHKDASTPLLVEMIQRAIGDERKVRELQKALGITLSGHTDKAVFFCYGPPDTGKTTTLNAVKHLLGTYAKQMSLESITAGRERNQAMWAADLHKSRYALASEMPTGFNLDVATIKAMTGDTVQKARMLYAMPFDSAPTYSMFIDTNYRPNLPGSQTDEAIWNRIHLIHFKNKVRIGPKENGYISNFKDVIKSKEEMERLLAWCVEGYRMWREEGLTESDEMASEKREYRDSTNVIGAFAGEYLEWCAGDAKAVAGIDTVRKLFIRWGKETYGYKFNPDEYPDFNAALEKMGFVRPEKNKWCEGKSKKVWQYMKVTNQSDTMYDVPENENIAGASMTIERTPTDIDT